MESPKIKIDGRDEKHFLIIRDCPYWERGGNGDKGVHIIYHPKSHGTKV